MTSERQTPTTRADLKVGQTYRIIWPTHYNHHQKTVGYRGRFLGWRKRHCSLHGDFIGWEAEFVKIKDSGRESHRFAACWDEGIIIRQEQPA